MVRQHPWIHAGCEKVCFGSSWWALTFGGRSVRLPAVIALPLGTWASWMRGTSRLASTWFPGVAVRVLSDVPILWYIATGEMIHADSFYVAFEVPWWTWHLVVVWVVYRAAACACASGCSAHSGIMEITSCAWHIRFGATYPSLSPCLSLSLSLSLSMILAYNLSYPSCNSEKPIVMFSPLGPRYRTQPLPVEPLSVRIYASEACGRGWGQREIGYWE